MPMEAIKSRIIFPLLSPLILGLLLFTLSCQSDPSVQAPDVSDIAVEPEFHRFDRALFLLDTTRMEEALATLEAKYPRFSSLYFEQILRSKDQRVAPEGHPAYVKGFITFPAVRALYDTCQVVFGDFSGQEDAFRQAFRYLKYYFPELPTPSVTTFISEFTYGAFIYGENDLAVGLDFFLGREYPYRAIDPTNPNFSEYLTRTFTPDHLVLKTLIPLAEDLLGPPPGDQLLDYMIHNGKKLYLLDALLPAAPDSIIMEVSTDQLAWLETNTQEMWAFFLQEDLFYSADWQKIRKYVEYSPHSPGMPPEAPGRTGDWLGWQIVSAYMEQQPEVDMVGLIANRDAQDILRLSRYKPRRR